jgi:hypothetical protein
MSILDKTYDDLKGVDTTRGGMEPKVLDCKISKPEIKQKKGGNGEYISIDLAYKDDSGEWRYIRYNNFNPEKSTQGKQLWKNLLVVAGAKNGNALEGKDVKVVGIPTPYQKADGTMGKSYKVYDSVYFSKDGKSAGEISEKREAEKLRATLQACIEEYDDQPREQAQAESTPETDTDMPF